MSLLQRFWFCLHVISYRVNPILINNSSDSHGFKFHCFDSYVECRQFDRLADMRTVFPGLHKIRLMRTPLPAMATLSVNRSAGPRKSDAIKSTGQLISGGSYASSAGSRRHVEDHPNITSPGDRTAGFAPRLYMSH